MTKANGAIAILGGMGPEASAKMLEVMVSMASKKFGARKGSEFPEIIVDSIPVPEFISNKRRIRKAFEILKNRVVTLSKFEVSYFGIACNTAHILLEDLAEVSEIPFVSMIDEVVRVVYSKGLQKVGLLATSSTINAGLYQISAKKLGIDVIIPTEIQIHSIEKIIKKVISGELKKNDSIEVADIVISLQKRGAKGIILGCTELSLIFPKTFTLQTFDSLEILAEELLKKVYIHNK